MDSAPNLFSYCVGGLALLSTIISVLSYCRRYLPITQLKLLDDLLVETKNIYRKANDEHLLSAEVSAYAQGTLTRYEDQSDKLREVTYRARSCTETLCSLFLGHTRRIRRLAEGVSRLRSYLMTVSQKEKARKAKEIPSVVTITPPVEAGTSEGSPQCTVHDEHGSLSHYLFPPSASQELSSLPQISVDNASHIGVAPHSANHRPPSCFVCSFLGWWRDTSFPRDSEASLPSSVAYGLNQSTSYPDAGTSSSSSTLVDEPLRTSTSRAWALFTDWTFLRYQATDVIMPPAPGDIPQSHHDSTSSLPV